MSNSMTSLGSKLPLMMKFLLKDNSLDVNVTRELSYLCEVKILFEEPHKGLQHEISQINCYF